MNRPIRYTALCVGVLLLAVPAAWACGEFGAMAAQCPMSERTESMGTSMCHDGGQMPEVCCDLTSAAEPMQALSVENAKLLAAFEVTDLQEVAPPALVALPLHSTSVDAFWPRDLGRYTLFSSFLL